MLPAVGTLLNLGLCNRQLGRLATAWHAYRRAEQLALDGADSERALLAHAEAAELRPRLATLRIELHPRNGADTVVTLDGRTLSRAELHVPLYVDAGWRVVSATAQQKKGFSSGVALYDGARATIVVPVLDVAPLAPAPRAPVTRQRAGSWMRTAGLVAAGTGLVGLGFGGYFAYHARQQQHDSNPHCNSRDICDAEGLGLRADAATDARRATVFGAVGLAWVGAGAALWFLAPEDSARIGLSGASGPRSSVMVQVAGDL